MGGKHFQMALGGTVSKCTNMAIWLCAKTWAGVIVERLMRTEMFLLLTNGEQTERYSNIRVLWLHGEP